MRTAALSYTENLVQISRDEECANHCLTLFIYEGFTIHHAHTNGPGKGLCHEPRAPEVFLFFNYLQTHSDLGLLSALCLSFKTQGLLGWSCALQKEMKHKGLASGD